MTLTFRPATPEDSCMPLRDADLDELASYGRPDLSPEEHLRGSILASEGHAVAVCEAGGALVAVYGVSFGGEREMHPWLLCSPRISRHRKSALRVGRALVGRMQEAASCGWSVHNYVAAASVSAQAFIKALGFRILKAPSGPFDHFHLPYVPTPRSHRSHRRSSP